MFYKIKSVKALPGYQLLVKFTNKEKKKYDVKHLFKKIKEFKALSYTKGLFEQVKVDIGGYGVVWNDDLDLSCNELYKNGKKEV